MASMMLDRDACYRALRSRDPRFDGRLFVGVRTTGIYCRPICPARTPKPESCAFFPSAAAAQAAGFRPCLRCRPEISPQFAAWRGTSNTVHRALALIAEGGLDGDDARIERLAERLGMGAQQLRRLFRQHLGASPVKVAQTRRVLFAKQLIHETRLPMAEVALAAGFGSVRRFNHIFKQMFGRPPRELRRRAQREEKAAVEAAIELTLSYSGPYDWDGMLAFLAARAIPGVELVANSRYHRTIELAGRCGWIEVSRRSPSGFRGDALLAAIRFPDVGMLPAVVARIRRLFDLDADVCAIDAHLASDRALAPMIAARPGLRMPGAWDEFELAVRAILGQQITVGAGSELAGRLVRHHGRPLALGGSPPGLTHAFPDAASLTAAPLAALGMPRARAAAVNALAAAYLADPQLFVVGRDLDEAVARLCGLPGVGEWTAHYIAMRAMREPDAFPAADIGLLRAWADHGGQGRTPAELWAEAEAWRPWRAYAAIHLWASQATRSAPQRPTRSLQAVEAHDAAAV